jgi:hypothetical protein
MMEVTQRLSKVIVIEDMGLSCRDVSLLRRRSSHFHSCWCLLSC